MSRTEREKMAAGEWYSCLDPELDALRMKAREAVHEHNTLPPGTRGAIGPALRRLLAEAADAAFVLGSSPVVSFRFNRLAPIMGRVNGMWLPIASDIAVSPAAHYGSERVVWVNEREVRALNKLIFE